MSLRGKLALGFGGLVAIIVAAVIPGENEDGMLGTSRFRPIPTTG